MRPIREVLAMEMRLNSGGLLATVLVAVLSVTVAVLNADGFMIFLPIWAALAWYRYGRADTIERDELRASLGLTRADKVRGRVALVAVDSAILIVISSLWLLLAPSLDLRTSVQPGAAFTLPGPPGAAEGVLVLIGAVQTVFMLLLTAIAVGGECVTRRPGVAAAMMSCAVYLGAGLLSGVLFGLPMGLITLSGHPMLPYLLVGAAAAVLCAVLALVLRRRVRVWISLLDSGAQIRRTAAI